MNLDNEIIAADQKVKQIMESGYTRTEALQLIQTAAITKFADCVMDAYNGKTYLNVTGNIVTYQQ